MWSKLIVIASIVGAASAACPNQCSGHGTCSGKEVCTCYDNWGMGGFDGGDCSDRMCPYELAWVDSPTKTGATHQYAECAAKGICDRETGQCECLTGYTGKACAHQICPDDCSGHGTCAFMSDLTFGTVYNDFYDGTTEATLGVGTGGVRPTTDYNWDSDRARACVCDGGWSGINCASRMCPYGNDAMDSRSNSDVAQKYQIQDIKLMLGGDNRKGEFNLDATKVSTVYADIATFMVDNTFALTFTSKLNEQFTTKPIKIVSGWDTANSLGDSIATSLKELPNHIITNVEATAAATLTTNGVGIQLLITFTGDSTHGTQNLLEVSVNPCDHGCTPLITGIPNLVSSTNTTSSVSQSQAADYNSYECGRRGKCDYDTGVCSCFEGFTGESCTIITALV